MSSQRKKKSLERNDNDSKIKINNILDEIIQKSIESPQLDSFYREKNAEIKSIDEASFPIIARRFQKSNFRERDVLLEFLKHFNGVEHIIFFQEFVKREPFLPRTGLVILELFNKSDAILEEGLASKLLDYDGFAQKIKYGILNNDVDDLLISNFLKCDKKEKTGIINQLIDEVGIKLNLFLIKIIKADENEALNILNTISLIPEINSYDIIINIYNLTNKKEIHKIIKKMIHTLRHKGIDVSFSPIEEKKDVVFKKASLPESRAFVSTIDAEGCRLLFMIKPITTYEIKIFNIFMSDVQGIKGIEVINAFRKESQIFIKKLLSDKKTEFIETQLDHAVFLVEEACITAENQGSVLSSNILQWRNIFSDLSGIRKHPIIYDHFKAGEIRSRNDLAGNEEGLFEGTDIGFWFIICPEAKESWMKMTNIYNSPIVLSDAQKKERVHGIQADTANQFFTNERKIIFKKRLEEVAYILLKKNHLEKAELAVYAALALDSSDLQAASNRFCMGMIKAGFKYFDSVNKGADGKQGSNVAEPKDYSLIA